MAFSKMNAITVMIIYPAARRNTFAKSKRCRNKSQANVELALCLTGE